VSDGAILGTILAVVGGILAVITSPDRKIARRWFRRRHDEGRDCPTQRVLMSLTPLVFWAAAAVAIWLGRR
jgi:hypothetical protein